MGFPSRNMRVTPWYTTPKLGPVLGKGSERGQISSSKLKKSTLSISKKELFSPKSVSFGKSLSHLMYQTSGKKQKFAVPTARDFHIPMIQISFSMHSFLLPQKLEWVVVFTVKSTTTSLEPKAGDTEWSPYFRQHGLDTLLSEPLACQKTVTSH